MQTIDTFGPYTVQRTSGDAKARAWWAGIIDVGVYYRAHGVDPQAARHLAVDVVSIVGFNAVSVSCVLFHRVESDVRTAGNEFVDGLVGVNRAICMHLAFQFINSQLHFVHRTCRWANAVFSENRERAPQSIRLECHNDFCTCLAHHVGYQVEIIA